MITQSKILNVCIVNYRFKLEASNDREIKIIISYLLRKGYEY